MREVGNQNVIGNLNAQWTPSGLNKRDQDLLKTVLAGAVSSGDKSKCGRGYMGLVLNDGRVAPVKFLTHATERGLGFKSDAKLMAEVGLSGHGDKAFDSSEALEAILRNLADKVGARDVVERLLERYSRHVGRNGRLLLSREVVFNAATAINKHAKVWGGTVDVREVEAESTKGKNTSAGQKGKENGNLMIEKNEWDVLTNANDSRLVDAPFRKRVTNYFDDREHLVKLIRDTFCEGNGYELTDMPVEDLKNLLIDMRVLRGKREITDAELKSALRQRWPELKFDKDKKLSAYLLALLNDEKLSVRRDRLEEVVTIFERTLEKVKESFDLKDVPEGEQKSEEKETFDAMCRAYLEELKRYSVTDEKKETEGLECILIFFACLAKGGDLPPVSAGMKVSAAALNTVNQIPQEQRNMFLDVSAYKETGKEGDVKRRKLELLARVFGTCQRIEVAGFLFSKFKRYIQGMGDGEGVALRRGIYKWMSGGRPDADFNRHKNDSPREFGDFVLKKYKNTINEQEERVQEIINGLKGNKEYEQIIKRMENKKEEGYTDLLDDDDEVGEEDEEVEEKYGGADEGSSD